MARATSSFPVPVSPRRSTVASEGATCSTSENTSRMGGELPTISSNPAARSSSPRSRSTSRRARSCATAWRSTSASSSKRMGLVR